MTGGAASLAPAGVHRGPIAFSGGGAAVPIAFSGGGAELLIAFGCGAVALCCARLGAKVLALDRSPQAPTPTKAEQTSKKKTFPQ